MPFRPQARWAHALLKVGQQLKRSPDGCWLWQGASAHGYGVVRVAGSLKKLHRLSYELMVGDIPTGYDIDHLCRVRNCINPEHLEPVTRAENTRRGDRW